MDILYSTDARLERLDLVVGYTCSFVAVVAAALRPHFDNLTYLILFHENRDNLHVAV